MSIHVTVGIKLKKLLKGLLNELLNTLLKRLLKDSCDMTTSCITTTCSCSLEWGSKL